MPASAAPPASQLSITQFLRQLPPKRASAAEGVVAIVDTSSDDGINVSQHHAAGLLPTLTRRRRINDDDDDNLASVQLADVAPSHIRGISQARSAVRGSAQPSVDVTIIDESDSSDNFAVLLRETGAHPQRSPAMSPAVRSLAGSRPQRSSAIAPVVRSFAAVPHHNSSFCNVSRCASILMAAILMRRSSMRMRCILPSVCIISLCKGL